MNEPVLDFAAGSAWVTEFLVLMGFRATAFDIKDNLKEIRKKRINSNLRIKKKNFKYAQGDGHNMPFKSDSFGTILTFDSLHHMHDYDKVFSEFYRVIQESGRAIFVEPGARHSKSEETIKFLKTMEHDPTWIERDVVLDSINEIAKNAGFKNGIRIIPTQHPLALTEYNMEQWNIFKENKDNIRNDFCNKLFDINYNERVIFYVQK